MFCGKENVSACVIYLLALAPAVMISTREQEAAAASSPSASLCGDSLISFPLRAPAQWHDGPVQPLSSGLPCAGGERKKGRLGGAWVEGWDDPDWGNACLTLPVRAEHRELISRPVSDHLTGSCRHSARHQRRWCHSLLSCGLNVELQCEYKTGCWEMSPNHISSWPFVIRCYLF